MAMNFKVEDIRYAISEGGLDNVCTAVEMSMSKSKTVTVPKYEVSPAVPEVPAVTEIRIVTPAVEAKAAVKNDEGVVITPAVVGKAVVTEVVVVTPAVPAVPAVTSTTKTYSAEFNQLADLDVADAGDFVAYENVTEETAINWGKAALGPTKLTQIEANLDFQIANKSSPPTPTTGSGKPWE